MPKQKHSTISKLILGFVIGIAVIFIFLILTKRTIPSVSIPNLQSLSQSLSVSTSEPVITTQSLSDIIPVMAKFCDKLGSYDVAWTLKNPSNNAMDIKLSSQVPQYSETKIDEVQLNPGETKSVNQCITFDESTLEGITVKTPASLKFEAYAIGNSNPVYQKSVPASIEAYDDMIWSSKTPMDNAEMIAAWVTPTNQSIMDVLSKAKTKMYSNNATLMGCQVGIDKDRMNKELKAIYDTLSFDYGISYVSETVSFAPGSSQRVSFPSQSLQNKSANCIDGSVLFASLAEALNYQPEIIIVPGHAFVGIGCDAANNETYIETTDLGKRSLFILSSFDKAVQDGTNEFNNYFAGKTDCRPEEYTCIVPIEKARTDGITPLE